jgi:hypothetical protein
VPPPSPRNPSPAPTSRQPGPRLTVLTDDRPPVLVVSHERSGTHFLMNAIARGYGYTSWPWIDFDTPTFPINYYQPQSVANALSSLADRRVANIVKSHHAVGFFDGVLDRLLRRYVVFYIHRDPVDVMLSFWRFMHEWPWREGLKRDDPLSFARSEPEGQMMRYQINQRRNLLDRWARHVEGWRSAAEGRPRLRIVAYASLRDQYEATLGSFASLLGRLPTDLASPKKGENVVRGPNRSTLEATPADIEALKALAIAEVGDTMRSLGYA